MPKLRNNKSKWEGYVNAEAWEAIKERGEHKRYTILDANAHEAPNDTAQETPAEAKPASYGALISQGDALKKDGQLEDALAKYEQAQAINDTAKIKGRITSVKKLIDAAAENTSDGLV